MGLEPTTSSLGIQTYVGSKSLARFCCEFLNLQRLAESAFSKLDRANEAQMRHVLPQSGDVSNSLAVTKAPFEPNENKPQCRIERREEPPWPPVCPRALAVYLADR